ncbi:hypothetical protein KEM56_006790, partial [Ascosphaera pollenicola]
MFHAYCESKTSLSSEEEWHLWYSAIRSNAKALDIWDFVNPDDDNADLPDKPLKPTPASINPGATTAAQLTANERRRLEDETSTFERLCDKWSEKKQRIRAVQALILASLAPSAKLYAKDKGSPKEMLRSLKSRFATMDEFSKTELRQQYKRLTRPIHDIKCFEDHCQRWLLLEQEAKQLKLESFTSADMVFILDFVKSLRQVARSFASTTLSRINNAVADGDTRDIPDLKQLVRAAREQVPLASRIKPLLQDIFSSGGGNGNGSNVRTNQGSGYQSKKLSPTPYPAIQAKLSEFLDKNPPIREKTEKSRSNNRERQEGGDQDESTAPSSSGGAHHLPRTIFAAHHATMNIQDVPYPPRDSLILNPGTT